MERLEFLGFVNRTPYKEALACLAIEEGLNTFELMDKLIGRSVGTTVADLQDVLSELQGKGLLASVNDRYHFHETWFKELVLFLDEFEESKREIDLCEVLLKKSCSKK